MEEGWGVVQALISASSGLTGVWLGGHLTSRREERRQKAERQLAATYLATLVLAHLDRLVEECVDVSFDDGASEGRPAGEDGYSQATTSTPCFEPLSLEVDWKAISADVMYDLLNLPHRIHELQRYLNNPGFDDPPDYADYFWTRRYEFAQLGLDVIALASRLRSNAGLPPPTPGPGGQQSDALLRERKDQLAEVRRAFEERQASAMSAFIPPAPSTQSY